MPCIELSKSRQAPYIYKVISTVAPTSRYVSLFLMTSAGQKAGELAKSLAKSPELYFN